MTLTIPQLQELRHVEAYDLATFLQGVEQAIKDGYEISLEHNETYPYGTIGHYIVKMPKSKGSVEQVKEPVKKEVLTIKVDASEVQSVVDKAVEEVKTLVEAHEAQQTTEGTEKQSDVVVEAPKKAETATQDVKAKPGRPAKGK